MVVGSFASKDGGGGGDPCLHSRNSSTRVALLEMGLMILNLATKEFYQLYHWLSVVTTSTM